MSARISLCGGLEVELDGERVEDRLPGRQGPLVLALLVLNRARPVRRDELIGALWPGEPPADPDEALSAVLSKVRQAVGRQTLSGRRELTLALPADAEVDFEQAVAASERAQAAIADGDWPATWEAARAALEIADRGFLVGLDAPWVEERRGELEELRLGALQAVAEAGVALGGAHLAGAERAAHELVRAAPLRQAGHRLLMEALAARGEVAQALAAYEELRVLLREELGIAPGEAVRALHERLVAGAPARAGAVATEATAERVPLPALLLRERGELVGRERELESLRRAWAEARAETRRLVVLCGEPGIGKTRLVGELAREAHADGTVLYAGCEEEALVSYQPFVEALRHYARNASLDQALDRLGAGGVELARLIPELSQQRPDGPVSEPEDPEARRYLLFEAVSALLTEACQRAPLLLVLDDLHWADRSTLRLLRHVVRAQHEAALLIIGTYREAEVAPEHPLFELLADLRRDGLYERLALKGLDRGGVGALIAAHAGHEAPSAFVDTVHAETEGNPFFVEEVVRHLIETGMMLEHGGRWTSGLTAEEIGVPEGVKEVLARRLARLSHTCRDVLSQAAVLGREFSFDLLPAMTRLDGDELIGALEEALGARLVVEGESGSTHAFTHALVRETLYGALSAPRRQRMHARAARAIEGAESFDADAQIAALAAHWWEARRLPEALASSLAAATAAEELFAFSEALRHREHALQIWDQVPDAEARAGSDLAELLARAAEDANLILEPARAIAFTRRAIELVDVSGDAMRAALLRERLGRYLWLEGYAADALQSYQEAVNLLLGEAPTPELARVLAGHAQILMLRGRTRESRERCQQAIQVARSVGARAEEGHALNTLGVAISNLGDRGRGIELLSEAKAIAEELGWIEAIGRAYVNLTAIIDKDGRLRESVEVALEGTEAMRRLGAPLGAIFLGNDAARRMIRLGRLAEAAQALARVGEARPFGISEASYYTGEAELACIRGELEPAFQASRLARRAFRGSRDSIYFGPAAAAEVAVHLAAGRPADAIATFERALELVTGEEDAFSLACLYARGVRACADRAEHARARGDDDQAAEAERAGAAVFERFDALLAPEHFPEGDPPPLAHAYRAVIEAEMSRLCGRSDASAWSRAAEHWTMLDQPVERAAAARRQAEALLLAGEARDKACELLVGAAENAHQIGATTLLGEIDALASRERVPLPEPPVAPGEHTPAPPKDGIHVTDR